MSNELPPSSTPSTPENEVASVAHDIQSGVETAGQIVEGVAQAAEQVEGFIEGSGGSPTVPGALRGASGAVGGAGQLLGALGVNDAGVSGVIGVAQQALALASTAYTAVEQVVQTVESIMNAEARLEEVRFDFEVLDTDFDWEIHDLHIEDTLGGTYLARIELCTEDLENDPNDLLGRSVSFTMSRKHLIHAMRGIVQRVEHGLSTDRAVIARIEVVPAAALLGYGQDTRIFQDLSVPEILDAVLGVGLQEYDRTLELRLGSREYLKREYCTQRDESDWHFALRLMQEEGIACFFEHTELREKLVLIDDNQVYETVPTLSEGAIRFIPSENVFDAIEPIRDLVHAHQLTNTKVAVADYDWSQVNAVVLKRNAQLLSDPTGSHEHGSREHYVSGQPATLSDWDMSDIRYRANDLRDQLAIRGELLKRDKQVMRGRGVVSGMAPGLCFTLSNHPSASLNQEYLLTHVTHSGRNQAVAHLFDHDEARPYENTFIAIPRSVMYRPERTLKKPRISGMESAVVVGPDSESEIHTDNFRRVKVQFRWDRVGTYDTGSSCYLRVMQAWAGHGFGVDFLPRVGMEVVVSYLGGDPDRPFITGCLYNQTAHPPYTSEADKTKSTIRTRTSPDDNGKFNELRFDDKKDGEEILIHASRDFNEVVERNHTTRVKSHQTNTVSGNRAHTVTKHETIAIEGSQKTTVSGGGTGDGQSVKGVELDVTGIYQLHASEQILETGDKKVRIACGTSYFEMTPERIAIHAGGSTLVLEAGMAELKAAGGSLVRLNASAKVYGNDGAEMNLTADARIENASGSVMRLQGDCGALTSSAGGSAEMTADALVIGTNATVSALASAVVSGTLDALLSGGEATGNVKVSASGADVGGPMVRVQGSMTTQITAPIVIIN
jgi:type VI secretion system secreted protein VgrG